MPRAPRGCLVDTFLHVTARGNRDAPLFVEDGDREFFLRCLHEFGARFSVDVHAYCLMTNHFHLLLQVAAIPVSQLMHRLLQRHAQYINRLYGHRGHLFADRFWARPCPDDSYAISALRYIHQNPVRAGLASAPEIYRWSSHRVYLGLVGVGWVKTALLTLFGIERDRAIAAYARFVAPDATTPTRPD